MTASVEEFIDSGAEPAERMIRNLVDCELAYINTDHPSFIGGSKAISIVMEKRAKMDESSSEEDLITKSKHPSSNELALIQPSKGAGLFQALSLQ